MNRGRARRRQIRIEAAGQLEIDLAVCGQVDILRAVPGNAAMPGDVSTIAHHVNGLDMDGTVGEGEARRTLAVQLRILQLDVDLAHVPLQPPLPRIAHRPLQGHGTADRGVPGELLAQVGVP